MIVTQVTTRNFSLRYFVVSQPNLVQHTDLQNNEMPSFFPISGSHLFVSFFDLQCLKRDLLRLMHTRTLDRPQLGQEFTLQWVVIRRGPLSMFLQWLSNAHFKIQTSTTYLTGDGGAGQGLECR